MTRARAAHATASAVVTRERFLLLGEKGARNVAENPPAFVYSSRGSKIVAGRDATAEGIGALTRHAETHARGQRETWGGRRAA